MDVSDVLSRVLAVDLARMARTLLEETTDPRERWERLKEVLGQVAKLRARDHKWQRLKIARERWGEEQERREEKQDEKYLAKLKQQATAPIRARLMQGPLTEAFGGGEKGREIAEFVTAVENDLPLPPWAAPAPDGQKPRGGTRRMRPTGVPPKSDVVAGPVPAPAPNEPPQSGPVPGSQG